MKITPCSLLLVLVFALTSALHAGSVNLGSITSVDFEFYVPYNGDYSYALVNTDTSQTVATLQTLVSTPFYYPDTLYEGYDYGASGSAAGDDGEYTWSVESLPEGHYRLDYTGVGYVGNQFYNDLSPYMDIEF